MPLIVSRSNRSLVLYHNGALHGHNHCIMLLPSKQIEIVVLTNSISQGDIAEWVAQTLPQAALDPKTTEDLLPVAREATTNWRAGYQKVAETLEKEQIPNTPQPSGKELIGRYVRSTNALFFRVYEEDDFLKLSINEKTSHTHTLTQCHNDIFSFFPSAEERMKRSRFHYGTHAWLLF